MPTCKFFLEGMCSREDCPYLHVKVNPKAEICQDFLKGYCKQAQEVINNFNTHGFIISCIICLVRKKASVLVSPI